MKPFYSRNRVLPVQGSKFEVQGSGLSLMEQGTGSDPVNLQRATHNLHRNGARVGCGCAALSLLCILAAMLDL